MNQRDVSLFLAHQRSNGDPEETLEVRVERRIVDIHAATISILKFFKTYEGREVIKRPHCRNDIEEVRDSLSVILDKLGGK